MQPGAAPVVTDVGVASRLEEPLGERQVSIDAGLQQRHVGLRRIVDEDIGHVRVGIRKFQRTCIDDQRGKTDGVVQCNLNIGENLLVDEQTWRRGQEGYKDGVY